MIKWTKGNLLDSEAEALVNTVNTVGVMGKGIALQFRETFPHNFREYKRACAEGKLEPGGLLVVKDRRPSSGKEVYIINFATKKHWRHPSRYEYIEKGLRQLVQLQHAHGWKHIAVPPVGCGNGKLDWEKVKSLMEQYLGPGECLFEVYEPDSGIKKRLQRQQSAKDRPAKLTPARAMLLYLLFEYEHRGGDASLFAANKLAWFLQRAGENLKLHFEPLHYGPYSHALVHVLYHLNGSWLEGLEQKTVKPFEHLQLDYSKYPDLERWMNQHLGTEHRQRLERVLQLLEGFENDYGLELLSTLDYLRKETQGDHLLSEDEAVQRVQSWSKRKKHYLKESHIRKAWQHLNEFEQRHFEKNMQQN
ncbi:MAG: phosphatase [Gammaproteobacteria bacterium]|nr:MAG: phosphatase [Gammaproteobacteria bacterium]